MHYLILKFPLIFPPLYNCIQMVFKKRGTPIFAGFIELKVVDGGRLVGKRSSAVSSDGEASTEARASAGAFGRRAGAV